MPARLRRVVSVMILLGLTWVFAIFTFNGTGGVSMQYVFTVLNSLQGLFIFVFYCLLNVEAQKEWKNLFPRFKKQEKVSTISSKSSDNISSRLKCKNTKGFVNPRPSSGIEQIDGELDTQRGSYDDNGDKSTVRKTSSVRNSSKTSTNVDTEASLNYRYSKTKILHISRSNITSDTRSSHTDDGKMQSGQEAVESNQQSGSGNDEIEQVNQSGVHFDDDVVLY